MALHPADGVVHEVGVGLEVELFPNADAVDVDGLVTDAQGVSHLLAGLAGAEEFKDFEFAVGEAAEFTPVTRHGGDGFIEQALGDGVADVEASGVDGADGVGEPVRPAIFHEVAAGSSAQAALGIHVFIMHAEDEDGGAGLLGGDKFDDLHAGAIFQGEIDDGDAGFGFADELDAGLDVGGFSDEVEVFSLSEGEGDTLAEQGMVVDQNGADAV